MPYALTQKSEVSLAGEVTTTRSSVTSDGIVAKSPPEIAAAKAGNLTTRTDDNTGVLTMANGHGFATSDKLDVFWTGGKRFGMTATVSGNAVTVDGGSGDNLPVLTTAVAAMKPVEEALVADGDQVVGIEMYSNTLGRLAVTDDSGTVLLEKYLGGPGNSDQKIYAWMAALEPTNPLAGGAVAKVLFSHSSTTAAAQMRVSLLVN